MGSGRRWVPCGGGGGGVVQVGGLCGGFRGVQWVGGFSGWGEGSKRTNVKLKGSKGQTLGGLNGIKGANIRGRA